METPIEITTPEQREVGVREIAVDLGDHHTVRVEVSLKLTQRRNTARPDEAVEMKPTTELVSNHNLAIALIRIASVSVTRVGNRL